MKYWPSDERLRACMLQEVSVDELARLEQILELMDGLSDAGFLSIRWSMLQDNAELEQYFGRGPEKRPRKPDHLKLVK